MLFLTTSGPLRLIACSALPCPPCHTLINPLWLGLQRSAGLLRSLQPSSLAFVAPTGELYEVQVHVLQSGCPDSSLGKERLLTVFFSILMLLFNLLILLPLFFFLECL